MLRNKGWPKRIEKYSRLPQLSDCLVLKDGENDWPRIRQRSFTCVPKLDRMGKHQSICWTACPKPWRNK